MSFEEICQKLGRRFKKNIYYFNNDGERIDINVESIERVKVFFNASVIGTLMKGAELELKENVDIPNELFIEIKATYDEETATKTYGAYYIYETVYNADSKTYTCTCYDKMLKTMIDYEPLNMVYPCTIQQYFDRLVSKLGFVSNVTLDNGNIIIPGDVYSGINYTYRSVLQDIAEANGVLLCVENNEIKIAEFNDENVAYIDDDILKNSNIDFGEHYGAINTLVLSRAGDSDNIYYPEILPENPVEFKISDNQLMSGNNRSEFMPAIHSRLNGLEYDIYDTELVGFGGFNPLQKIIFNTGDNQYSSYALNNEMEWTSAFKENIYTDLPEESVTDYSYADTTDQRINQAYLIVDKQNQTINGVVSQVDNQNEKIAEVLLNVDELNTKIKNVADITMNKETIFANMEMEGINAGNPISIKIYPVGESISYLYPNSNLYPSDSLYSKNRTLRFFNTKTNETYDWELPTNLWFYNSEYKDTLTLSYDANSVVIERRCGVNEDGTIYVLSNSQTETYEYPKNKLNLTDGDYEITLLGYNNAYLNITLMASNIYTSQFATRVEMASEISQKADEINLSVSQRYATKNELSNAETQLNSTISQTASNINLTVSRKVGKEEVVSSINQSAESIKINANKLNLSGYVTISNLAGAGTTTIDGSNIKTGTISSARLSSDVITTNNLSAQNISASQITSGTLSANRISGGTINANSISVTNLSASNINRGSLNGIPYSFDGGTTNGRVSLGTSDGPIMGYHTNGGKRWSIAAFTAGGRFQTFDVNGTMAAYFNHTGAHTSSDIRYKENIENIKEQISMNVIQNLNPIEYNYIGDDTKHRGLSAQEVEKVLKDNEIENEIYEINEEGRYSLNYIELIPDLINCIKYQQKEIETLKEILKESD